MISDEVRMLLNRMETNPDEFIDPEPKGFRADVLRANTGKWDTLMMSLTSDKPELSMMFEPEEIEALRAKAKELIQARIRASIVKQIVGGEDKAQMEMDLTDSTVYKKRTLLTQAELIKMKATGQI
jgi:hypothetical protein